MSSVRNACLGRVRRLPAGLLAILFLPISAFGEEEMASRYKGYQLQEQSGGYYEEYEVRPIKRRPGVEPSVFGRRFLGLRYDPSELTVRSRTSLSDSHRGIKFYNTKTCQSCHPETARNLHTQKANITCYRCHGGEPIAGINHHFSPINPVRRHAYVCAKCHEGATPSFATYFIHDPAPESWKTLKTFPSYYYAYWLMMVLLFGTLAFFVPHAVMVGVRELFGKKAEAEAEAEEVSEAPPSEVAEALPEQEPEQPSVEPEQKAKETAEKIPDQKTEGPNDVH